MHISVQNAYYKELLADACGMNTWHNVASSCIGFISSCLAAPAVSVACNLLFMGLEYKVLVSSLMYFEKGLNTFHVFEMTDG